MVRKGEQGNHGIASGVVLFRTGSVPLEVVSIPTELEDTAFSHPTRGEVQNSTAPKHCRISALFAGSCNRASISYPGLAS